MITSIEAAMIAMDDRIIEREDALFQVANRYVVIESSCTADEHRQAGRAISRAERRLNYSRMALKWLENLPYPHPVWRDYEPTDEDKQTA